MPSSHAISFNAPAISSACARLSIWQGPASTAMGASLAKVTPRTLTRALGFPLELRLGIESVMPDPSMRGAGPVQGGNWPLARAAPPGHIVGRMSDKKSQSKPAGTQRLAGRLALVTGATRGIGRAVALAFAREGAHLILVGRTAGALEDVDDEIRDAGGEATL